jgi:hypothetical protein
VAQISIQDSTGTNTRGENNNVTKQSAKFGFHIPQKEFPLLEIISPTKDLNPYKTKLTIKGRT